MREVEVRLKRQKLADALGEMRQWLDRHDCIPISFDIVRGKRECPFGQCGVQRRSHGRGVSSRLRVTAARAYSAEFEPNAVTSPPKAAAHATASLSTLNSRRHVTLRSSVVHRNASGSKRCLSNHSLIRAMIADSSSRSRRSSTTYNI